MRRPSRFVTAAAALLGVALAAACGSVDDAAGGSTAPSATQAAATQAAATRAAARAVVAVELHEWGIEPAPAAIDAGAVTFEVVNAGTLAHDFWVIRTDRASDALPLASGVMTPGDGDLVAGKVQDTRARMTSALSVDLDAGRYVLICNVVGHYELGMRAAFTIR